MIAEALQSRRGEELEILPENATAVRALQLCGTQWRMHPNGLPYGLDYQAAELPWRYAGLVLTGEDFARLQLLENTAIETFRENASSRSPGLGA
ncbi:hypothetical protein HPT27_10605 [Permianibacter sp. IMCC34836]|uniref:DUF1799 domain-containing protein n=1 Tax=Permianibacter fluminis TaxID=2738515 RepID=UPI001557FAEF|nr:DUF1799 domain-containing protein [Permianibacter fluminis]NQD37478.1 hypothetical protein [Permianibacter fluminis]